jgi:hypothetical protein
MRAVARCAARLSCLFALLGTAGCAVRAGGGEPTPQVAGPAAVARLAPPPRSMPMPPPAVPRAAPETPSHDVVLYYPGGDAADLEVATEIALRLEQGQFRVTLVDVEAPGVASQRRDVLPGAASVAVGRAAALRAAELAPDRPIVVCRVFDYQDLIVGEAPLWGVDALPPLSLQLRGWKAADNSLERVGLIISEAHADRIGDFLTAAQAIGLEVEVARSASDRETLYLFKRMAPRLDGFWLFPDNRILSPGVLRKLLDYASSHEVGVLVFSDALLSWGALLSARSLPGDVAASVQGVLERVVADPTQQPERMSSLSAVALDFNPDVAQRLNLAILPDTTWVLREPD